MRSTPTAYVSANFAKLLSIAALLAAAAATLSCSMTGVGGVSSTVESENPPLEDSPAVVDVNYRASQTADALPAFPTDMDVSGVASEPTPAPAANGRIAFTSDRDGNDEIYVMNADGSGQTRLTDNSTKGAQPGRRTDSASRSRQTGTATMRYTS